MADKLIRFANQTLPLHKFFRLNLSLLGLLEASKQEKKFNQALEILIVTWIYMGDTFEDPLKPFIEF